MSYPSYTYIDSPLFDPNFDMNRCSTTTPLYVEDLDITIDNTTLYNFFCQYGPVYSIKRSLSKDPLQSGKASCLIHFYFHKDAESALKDAQYHKFGRQYIILRLAEETRDLQHNARINVGNIEPTVTARELHNHFQKAGVHVLFAKVNTDWEGMSLGCGHVVCNGKEDANYAFCRLLLGTKLKNRELKLSINVPNYKANPNIDEKTLHVKYLPIDRDQMSLMNLLEDIFRGYGELQGCSVRKHPKKNMYSGVVEFKGKESAIAAYIDLCQHPKDYGAQEGPLCVDWYQYNYGECHNGDHNCQNADATIYMKNLRLTVKEEDLRRIFKRFGVVKSVSCQDYICSEIKKTARCGYICFSNEDEAHKACYEALNFTEVRELFSHKEKLYINLYQPRNERKKLEDIKKQWITEFQHMGLINQMHKANMFAFMAGQANFQVGLFSPLFNINQQQSPRRVVMKANKMKELDPLSLSHQMRDFRRTKPNRQRKFLENLLLIKGNNAGFGKVNKERLKELLAFFVQKILEKDKQDELAEKVTEVLMRKVGLNFEEVLEFVRNEEMIKKRIEEIAEQIEDEKLLKEVGDSLLKNGLDDASDTYSINDEDLSTHFKENMNPNVLLNSFMERKETPNVGLKVKRNDFENNYGILQKKLDIELVAERHLGVRLDNFLRLDRDMQRTRLGKALFESIIEIADSRLALTITPMLVDLSKFKVKEILEFISDRDLLKKRINETMKEIENGRKN